ncbi:putative leucoanthocyanidin dioxygenase [Cinnamomum micranthum f. kanehirae]|uniref:Putative leucoanthocyanidin dioxygenase n=1 Tax=Cinnamomum micranthum f. kanehirae TaxID=337451 RepID=A0A443NE89_9MAGN|nr:putative leucoanthocyanidin dioxygenase [Cinnamomum micranthum f. kanehirae]
MATLTILLQDDIGGLFFKVEYKGWIEMPPVEGAFIINIGDTLEILSNGRFNSAEHRVTVNSTKARVFMLIFASPRSDTMIGPLLPDKDGNTLYRKLFFEEYNAYYFKANNLGKKSLDYVKHPCSTPGCHVTFSHVQNHGWACSIATIPSSSRKTRAAASLLISLHHHHRLASPASCPSSPRKTKAEGGHRLLQIVEEDRSRHITASWSCLLFAEMQSLITSRAANKKIHAILLKALGVDSRASTMTQYIEDRVVYLNYCPNCPNPQLTFGASRYKGWIEIPRVEGTLIINIGDTLEILSGGRYKSIEHVNNTNARVSFPVFVSPHSSTMIGPCYQRRMKRLHTECSFLGSMVQTTSKLMI